MARTEVIMEFLLVLLQSIAATFKALLMCIFPAPRKSVQGKVILVTGAGGGLGRRISQKLALLGAKMVLVDRDQNNNEETLKSLNAMGCGDGACAITCDISRPENVRTMAERVAQEVGDVDIVVNNAGVLPGLPLLELSDEQIKRTLDVNTLAHLWMIRAFLPRMLERGQGHIVAIASVAGLLGCANLVDYCASKHAVMGLMSALREELHEMGREEQIRLTVVCPATMDTGLVQKPKTRFPSFLPILSAENVSRIAVDALLTERRLVVIPTHAHIIHKVANLFPVEVPLMLQRFFGYTIDPNVH